MAAVQPEVVQYLRENLKKFPVETLRAQLRSEGVSDPDIDEALKAALRAAPEASPAKKKSKAGLMLAVGVAVVAVIGALVAGGSRDTPSSDGAAVPPPAVEGAFVGQSGYVVRLPKGYTAVQTVRGRVEVVHFAKAGTDPTNFLHEGLFGQLGIVRLEVQPSPLGGNLSGVETLTRHVASRLDARGDKYMTKSLQLSSLRGVQFTVELPNPGVQGYVLGANSLYRFTAGQDDEIYREILNSLRDVRAEN